MKNTQNIPLDRTCSVCNNKKEINYFIIDFRKEKDFLPACKACTDKISHIAAEKFSNVAAGVWSACMVNNVPMISEAWEKATQLIVKADSKSPFAFYYRTLREILPEYEGVWQSDTWLGNFVKLAEEENNSFNEEFDIADLTSSWGKFTTEQGEIDYEAYEFLINRYNNYVENISGLTSAMEMQFRNLCKAEWQKIKADESGDIGEIDKAQKLVDRLLSALKLDDFAVEKSDTDRFIDKLIWRIEETEPAELEDETKYVDIEGHERIYESFMRSMRNLIANTREYPDIPEEEM